MATDEMSASRLAILHDLFSDSISAQKAAEHLASISLANEEEPEEGITSLWKLIIKCAYELPQQHDKIVDVLVQLSKLPDAKTSSGEPILLYEKQVWKDLPTLGWQFRDEWNKNVDASPPDRRQSTISQIINRDKLVARLMATKEPVFAYSWFALITLREALETPTEELSPESLEALIPAAAAWISILGKEIYEWNEEFDGALGRGGPLWEGRHGFSKERWQLWRKRFGDMARTELAIGDELKTSASEAVSMMQKIEN
ncbi:uncharacterized protein N7515_007480 [Penicillium bovifimosum]|uniref:Uncharacterized protein n=1 Tax=Penicillium bovifimosum TaxID=126998 RepID=A0A9W9GY24_9EURO|nr:uncharacterized protein N7515_007480 [Penicillium bovifimosum]KAJ5131441.1 hypothetical protein N7515_007480 [Penicillium bovifimosum]